MSVPGGAGLTVMHSFELTSLRGYTQQDRNTGLEGVVDEFVLHVRRCRLALRGGDDDLEHSGKQPPCAERQCSGMGARGGHQEGKDAVAGCELGLRGRGRNQMSARAPHMRRQVSPAHLSGTRLGSLGQEVASMVDHFPPDRDCRRDRAEQEDESKQVAPHLDQCRRRRAVSAPERGHSLESPSERRQRRTESHQS